MPTKTKPAAKAAAKPAAKKTAAAPAAKKTVAAKPAAPAKAGKPSPAARTLTVTARLWAVFDALPADTTMAVARDAAVAKGLNRTSAGLAFYRWRAARAAGVQGVPKGASKAQTYSA